MQLFEGNSVVSNPALMKRESFQASLHNPFNHDSDVSKDRIFVPLTRIILISENLILRGSWPNLVLYLQCHILCNSHRLLVWESFAVRGNTTPPAFRPGTKLSESLDRPWRNMGSLRLGGIRRPPGHPESSRVSISLVTSKLIVRDC